MEKLTVSEIIKFYPYEWVLIGNPEINGTTILCGTVIFHSKEKREIPYQHSDWKKKFKTATTFFTGNNVSNNKFWL